MIVFNTYLAVGFCIYIIFEILINYCKDFLDMEYKEFISEKSSHFILFILITFFWIIILPFIIKNSFKS